MRRPFAKRQTPQGMKYMPWLYWVTTGLLGLVMVASGFQYLIFPPEVKEQVAFLGYPDYFYSMLGLAKLVGAVILLVPFRAVIKEWVYSGFTINLLAATWSVAVTTVGSGKVLLPFLFLGVLFLSYAQYRARGRLKSV